MAPPVQRPLSPQPARARSELRSFLDSREWPGDVDRVVLAVHEALINSVDHAGGVASATAQIDGNGLVVEVRDRGPGFSPRTQPQPPDPLAERGRGLWLISQLADRWEVQRNGPATCVLLRFEPPTRVRSASV